MSVPANLCSYLERAAAANPDDIAVVDPYGISLSYAELDGQAARVAGFLAARGVAPGDRVGVIGPKSAAVVSALFGAMRAGAAYVPADYRAPTSRNVTLLTDCDVRTVILDRACAQIVEEWPLRELPEIIWLPGGRGEHPDVGWDWVDVVASEPLGEARLADSTGLAYILYTSGSTGKPKGVTLTHGNAVSFVEWCSSEFEPNGNDRFSSHAPFHFDLSIFDLYVSIKHGAQLHLISEDLGKNPGNLASFIAEHELTVWYSTPSILSMLAQFGGIDKVDCSSLRLVLFAGEVFPVKHLRNIVGRWPHAVFYNLYGPTETNVCTFYRIPGAIPAERAEPYPIGRLCSHCQGTVLDSPGGSEVAAGSEGLLHIAGPSLFQGYWNRTGDGLFCEIDGSRYYNTGDVVIETPQHEYVYVGRRDRMVKRRGYRIELGEIERGLYRSPKVREAAVIAVPDDSTNVRILAYVSPEADASPSIVELKIHCAGALPSYMNPDVFVILGALPRTSTDKVDYQRLVQMSRGE